jgi:hypothetical protein
MYNENKLNIAKNTKTMKKAKKAVMQGETAPAKAQAPVAAKTPAPVVVKAATPLETRPATPVQAKPVTPLPAKLATPVPVKAVTQPVLKVVPQPVVKAAAPVEVKAAAPVAPKPAASPQPQVVLEFVNPAAKKVCVAGSFNNWQPERTPLKSSGNGRWLGDLKVAPGRYEYLFVVDGQWLPDPNARESVQNPFGGKNSVLTVAA